MCIYILLLLFLESHSHITEQRDLLTISKNPMKDCWQKRKKKREAAHQQEIKLKN